MATVERIPNELREAVDADVPCNPEATLLAVPDGWAKVNGRWVELIRPYGHRNPYDFVEWDWAMLNKALEAGRIRILPEGTLCVCNFNEGTACAFHGREAS